MNKIAGPLIKAAINNVAVIIIIKAKAYWIVVLQRIISGLLLTYPCSLVSVFCATMLST